ncbi:hypothetical protein GALL_71040 [mine drainage metagenome]|uniref:Uncharacterized protein n=1 Tax=mine drainage metagenome TaxID=410659 RepID=A0A1J5T3W2_9ZZZZ
MGKCRGYMQGAEFKQRQGFFAFMSRQAIEYIERFKKECAKGWRMFFKKPEPKMQTQLQIDFKTTNLKFWAEWTHERNLKLFKA